MREDLLRGLRERGFEVVRVLKDKEEYASLLAEYRGERVVVKLGWGRGAARVENEARVLGELRGLPVVPRLVETGSVGDARFAVIEYVEGRSLSGLRAPRLNDAILTVFYLLDSLLHVNSRGFVHCDVKPSNVIASRRGYILIDFDVARRFDAGGLAAGTPGYTCPGALEGRPPGRGCDLYSVAALLYYLVTGSAPPREPEALARALYNLPAPRGLIELLRRVVVDEGFRDALDHVELMQSLSLYHSMLLQPHIVVDGVYRPAGYGRIVVGEEGQIRVPGRPVYLELHNYGGVAQVKAHAALNLVHRGRVTRLEPGRVAALEYGDIIVFDGHIMYSFIRG